MFQSYCGFIYGLLYGPIYSARSLNLVCRYWHEVVTACPALWTSIVIGQEKGLKCDSGRYERPISYRNWSSLESTLTRAGAATLSLTFQLSESLFGGDNDKHVIRLFPRCHDLRIISKNVSRNTFTRRITMPHLEHVLLDLDENARIEPLLDAIEKGSPLLRSLSICSYFPANMAQREALLRRLVHLYLCSIPEDNISFFRGLENLEHLE
jgi:hypothetical protein